jgi:hypothetical protein
MEKEHSHEHGTDFCRTIEKRIRKYTRINKLFKKGDRILVKDDVSEHFVRKIINELPVKIVKKGKADKIAESWTADDEINDFFMGVLGEGRKRDKRLVKMLLWVTDDELEKYCRINAIKFKRKEKDKAIQGLVDDITAKHPDPKHKIVKMIERMHDL